MKRLAQDVTQTMQSGLSSVEAANHVLIISTNVVTTYDRVDIFGPLGISSDLLSFDTFLRLLDVI
jgi:hypothetical protein